MELLPSVQAGRQIIQTPEEKKFTQIYNNFYGKYSKKEGGQILLKIIEIVD